MAQTRLQRLPHTAINQRPTPTKGLSQAQLTRKDTALAKAVITGRRETSLITSRNFSASNLIVSEEARDTMFTEGMPRDDRLVWSSANSDDWMKTNFKMPVVVWSNGIVEGTRAVLIRLPQNHYLILFTNSEDMSAGDLYNAGVAAFKAGMDHNFS